MKLTLQEIANLIDGSIEGDNTKVIYGLNSLVNADLNQISYAVSEKYKDAMINSEAGAIIVNQGLKDQCKTNAIIVKNVYLAYSILSHKFKQTQDINDLSFGNEVHYRLFPGQMHAFLSNSIQLPTALICIKEMGKAAQTIFSNL